MRIQIRFVRGMENFSTEAGDWAWHNIQYLRVDTVCRCSSIDRSSSRYRMSLLAYTS